MRETRLWTSDELTIALFYYCRIPFGKLHRHNPEIIALAALLNRTPSAVAMKLSNFASFDPQLQARQVSGLKNAGKGDREIWERFKGNWTELAIQGNTLISNLEPGQIMKAPAKAHAPTETVAERRVRLVQGFFREAVLSSYSYRCSVCSLQIVEMLNASHIIPWSADESRRADPANGISLCAFHDRAFDRGFFALNDEFQILLSRRIHAQPTSKFLQAGLSDFEGGSLILPDRFTPDKSCLKYHREFVFVD